MKIVRYNLIGTGGSGGGIIADENGWLVRFADYEAAVAELRATLGARDSADGQSVADRPVMMSDMVRYEAAFGTHPRAKWWTDRMNAGGVGIESPTTISTMGLAKCQPDGTKQSQLVSATAQATPPSAGTTASGDGSVGGANGCTSATSSAADALRGLETALDGHRSVWPDCNILTESAFGAAHIGLRHAADAVLALDIPAIIDRLKIERSEAIGIAQACEQRAEAAEAKVRELEDYVSQLIWNVTGGKLSRPFTSLRDIGEAVWDHEDEQIKKATATITRQLAKEREACDAWRAMYKSKGTLLDHEPPMTTIVAMCARHDARREREKQGEGTCETNQADTTLSSGSSTIDQPTGHTSKSSSTTAECDAPSATKSCEKDSRGGSPTTTDPPATVTDEDRRVAASLRQAIKDVANVDFDCGAHQHPTSPEYRQLMEKSKREMDNCVAKIAFEIARIRHQRDGEIRELVEALDAFKNTSDWPTRGDIDRATSLIFKHGGGK